MIANITRNLTIENLAHKINNIEIFEDIGLGHIFLAGDRISNELDEIGIKISSFKELKSKIHEKIIGKIYLEAAANNYKLNKNQQQYINNLNSKIYDNKYILFQGKSEDVGFRLRQTWTDECSLAGPSLPIIEDNIHNPNIGERIPINCISIVFFEAFLKNNGSGIKSYLNVKTKDGIPVTLVWKEFSHGGFPLYSNLQMFVYFKVHISTVENSI